MGKDLTSVSMWDYWRDKRGVQDALESDYPELLKENVELQQALIMVKGGLALIEQIMDRLEAEADDDDS